MLQIHADCPGSPGKEFAIDVAPGVSSQRVFVWISVICTIIVCISSTCLAATHMINYTIPREQRLLLRVIALPPVYSICNLIGTIFYGSDIYLGEFPKMVEAVGLAAVFELYVFYLTPGATTEQRDRYFESTERRHRFRVSKPKHDRGSLRWFHVTWALVFQYIPISWILAILQWIFATKLCPYGVKAQDTKVILEVLGAIFITFSIFSILTFERRMREDLRTLGSRRKLWGMKLFVGTTVIIQLVIAGLQKFDNIGQKTPHLNYFDLTIGVPHVLFELAMLIFCGVFWWAYPATRYCRAVNTPDATGATLPKQPAYRAIVDSLNILDVFKGVWFGLKVLALLPLGTKRGVGYHATGKDAEYLPERKPVTPTPAPVMELAVSQQV